MSQTFRCDNLNHDFNLSVSVPILIKISSTSNESGRKTRIYSVLLAFRKSNESEENGDGGGRHCDKKAAEKAIH